MFDSLYSIVLFFFFKQKRAYEIRPRDWSSDVCSSDLGIDVVDVGMVTTPMLYFAASTVCTSGIQVTGSHNPRDYNGFKMVMAGRAIYGNEIQALRKLMEQGVPHAEHQGKVRNVNILAPYRDRIFADIKLARPL